MTTDPTAPFASATWTVADGNADAFVKRWTAFLTWTKAEAAGLVGAHLLHDTNDPSHFVSVAQWESAEARQTWRALPAFAEHFAACRALCDDMYASDYVRVVDVG